MKGWFLAALGAVATSVGATDFTITNYGAIKDGAKCTEAFARTIAACAEAGGGRVVVPSGRWFSGAIRLKNNVELPLEEGSEILFSQDPNDYLPAVRAPKSWREVLNDERIPYPFANIIHGALRQYDWADLLSR